MTQTASTYAARNRAHAGGLLFPVLALANATPYQGEDLIYDAETPGIFLVRCSRHGAGPTPGMCLYGQRINTADVIVRFPRDWLGDWRIVAAKIERLINTISHQAD